MKMLVILVTTLFLFIQPSFSEIRNQLSAVENQLLSNMYTAQLTAEDFSTRMDGNYPILLEQTAPSSNNGEIAFKDMIPNGMRNPINANALVFTVASDDPPNWLKIPKGTVVYVPKGINKSTFYANSYIIFCNSGSKILKIDSKGASFTKISGSQENTAFRKSNLLLSGLLNCKQFIKTGKDIKKPILVFQNSTFVTNEDYMPEYLWYDARSDKFNLQFIYMGAKLTYDLPINLNVLNNRINNGSKIFVGDHDFDDDGKFEIIIAIQQNGTLCVNVFKYKKGINWLLVGNIEGQNNGTITGNSIDLSVGSQGLFTTYTWKNGKFVEE